MVGVIADRISGRHYAPAGLGMAQSVLSDEKEGCFYSVLLQYFENVRCIGLVGAVVKRQCDAETIAVTIR